MDATGKKTALNCIDQLRAIASTNLWAGLDAAIDVTSKISDSNINVLLLTDGQPNVNERAILKNLNNKITGLTNIGIHTFGYGYELDSRLLLDIGIRGGGMFGHIPDQTMCNTVILNFLTNTLITSINNASILMNGFGGCDFVKTNYNYLDDKTIIIGGIQQNQRRSIPVLVGTNDPNKIRLDLDISYYNDNVLHTVPYVIKGGDLLEPNYLCFLEGLKIIIKNNQTNLKSNAATLKEIDDYCETLSQVYQHTPSVSLGNLIKNIKSSVAIEGQIWKAFSNDEWYQRWGLHYLLAHFRAHELHLRTNFKDTALQNYGGRLFSEVLTEVEEIFESVPVPVASRATTSAPFAGNFQASTYTASGPCIDGYGIVNTPSGPTLIKDLKKGDTIINSNGKIITIVCVIKTNIKNGQLQMVKFGKILITPYHPILINNQWTFPHQAGTVTQMKCDAIYSFVVSGDYQMTVSSMNVVTLGHGIEDDPVLKHPFFGTNKVIDHLKKNSGWNTGLVEINDFKPKYDENKLMCGFW